MSRAAVPRRRSLHPVAWWLWAAGLAICAMRTNNPFLLALIGVVACVVVSARRSSAPWSRSIAFFLRLGVLVIVIRIVIEILFGQRGVPGHVLFTLPQVPLPSWAAAVSVGGPVTLESILDAFVLGLQLAVILLCFGAANSLASPYRLLRSLPAVLYETGVAVTVALSFTPEIGANDRDRAPGAPSARHSHQRAARHAGCGRSGTGGCARPLPSVGYQHGRSRLRTADLRGKNVSAARQRSHRRRTVAGGGRDLRRHRRRVSLRAGPPDSRRRRRALRGRPGRGGAPYARVRATAPILGDSRNGLWPGRDSLHSWPCQLPTPWTCRDSPSRSPLWRFPLFPCYRSWGS